jgi:hypothetical protein
LLFNALLPFFGVFDALTLGQALLLEFDLRLLLHSLYFLHMLAAIPRAEISTLHVERYLSNPHGFSGWVAVLSQALIVL